MQTITLLLAVFALVGCEFQSSYSKSAYKRGVADAKTEIARGGLAIESSGMLMPWMTAYKRILKERYGIDMRIVAGCLSDREIDGHAKGFNEVMMSEIRRKWPKDIFSKAVKEAQEEYKTQKNDTK